jgi:hypothetical protein
LIDNLESNYDCANASEDLHLLLKELEELNGGGGSADTEERRNRLENQISFIRNKCDIH